MPVPPPEFLIFEPFIETDEITIIPKSKTKNEGLLWKGKSRWVEITVGVIGKRRSMRSLMPSVTVKESGDILSLEEKFQGTESKGQRCNFTFHKRKSKKLNLLSYLLMYQAINSLQVEQGLILPHPHSQ